MSDGRVNRDNLVKAASALLTQLPEPQGCIDNTGGRLTFAKTP